MSNAFHEFKQLLIDEGLEGFGLYYGCYEAIVRNNEDPDKKGRIQVECPVLYGTGVTYEKWIIPRGRPAGDKWGLYLTPKVGDMVWISCRGGKPEFPMWEFGWWTNDQKMEQTHEKKVMFVTPFGHSIIIDEQNDDPALHTITITYKDGKSIELKEQNISLGTPGGSAEPAALGNTLKGLINDLCDAAIDLNTLIQSINIAVTTAPGIGTLNTAQLASFIANLQQFAVVQNNLDTFLSDVVTLD